MAGSVGSLRPSSGDRDWTRRRSRGGGGGEEENE